MITQFRPAFILTDRYDESVELLAHTFCWRLEALSYVPSSCKINRLKENLRQEDERKKEEVAAAQKEVDAAKEALHEKIEADRTVETSMQNDLEKQQHDFHDYQTKLDFEQKKLHTDTATEITKLREDAKQKKEEHDRKVVEEKEKALQEVIHADAQQAEAAKEAFNQALAKKEEDAKKLAQVKEEKGHIQYVDDVPVEHEDDALRHQDASNAVVETLPPAAEAPPVPVSAHCKTSAAQKCYKNCQHCIHCSSSALARTLCEDCHTKCGPCHNCTGHRSPPGAAGPSSSEAATDSRPLGRVRC